MRNSSSTENSTIIHCPQAIGSEHINQTSQMPEPKLERIIGKDRTIWRVTYCGMSRDFDSDWKAADFLHDLWLSNRKIDDLTRQ